jgi:hypothetical protein
MFKSLVVAATLVSSLAASTVQADHRRGGGNWGGARGGWGVGIGGNGFQLNIGRGGYGYGRGYGWGGYGGGWGGGYYGGYGSGYYSPGYYYGQTYSSPYYYTPGQVYSDTVVVPSGPQAPMFDGGSIVLTNPATNPETVEYALNGQPFAMRPGQSQRFTHDRDWIVEFNRGDGSNFARYSLKSATYKFKPASNGWELFEQAESRPSVGALPPPPANDSPARPVSRPKSANPPPPPVPKADEPKPQEFTSPSSNPETVVRPRQVPQP